MDQNIVLWLISIGYILFMIWDNTQNLKDDEKMMVASVGVGVTIHPSSPTAGAIAEP